MQSIVRAIALIVCLSTIVRAQPLDLASLLPESEPAYTQADADEWTQRLIPLVEEAAGRTFKTPPVVRVVDRATLTAALARDTAAGLAAQDIEGADAQATAELLAPALVAKYALTSRELLLPAGNLTPIGNKAGIDRASTSELLAIVIAHELTHALQDQHADLETFIFNAPDFEAAIARTALIEGHALLVQDQVAGALALDEANADVARIISAGRLPQQHHDALHPKLQFLHQNQQIIYTEGRDYVQHHHDRDGAEAIWALFDNPPPSTRNIAAPDAPAANTLHFLPLVVQSMAQSLEEDGWETSTTIITPMKLRTAFIALPDHQRRAVVGAVDDAQAVQLDGGSPRQVILITFFTLNDSLTTEDFLALSLKRTRSEAQRIANNVPGSTVSKVRATTCDAIEADATLDTTFTMAAGPSRAVHRTVRAARDRFVVEISITAASAPPDSEFTPAIDDFLDICTRLDEAQAERAGDAD